MLNSNNTATGLQTSTQAPTDSTIDIIFHNMHVGSEFRTFRAASKTTIEDVFLQVAQQVKNECYKIISISASKHSFVLVMTTELSREALKAKGFPFPIPDQE